MKRSIIAVSDLFMLTGSLYAQEGAFGAHFSSPKGKQATQVGGIVGHTVFFMYPKNDAAKIKDPTTLNMMATIAKKQICEGKDTRMLVEDMKMQVVFAYPNQKDGSVTVVTIDSCEGVKKGSKKEK